MTNKVTNTNNKGMEQLELADQSMLADQDTLLAAQHEELAENHEEVYGCILADQLALAEMPLSVLEDNLTVRLAELQATDPFLSMQGMADELGLLTETEISSHHERHMSLLQQISEGL